MHCRDKHLWLVEVIHHAHSLFQFGNLSAKLRYFTPVKRQNQSVPRVSCSVPSDVNTGGTRRKFRPVLARQMHCYKTLTDCFIEDNLESIVFAPWRTPDYFILISGTLERQVFVQIFDEIVATGQSRADMVVELSRFQELVWHPFSPDGGYSSRTIVRNRCKDLFVRQRLELFDAHPEDRLIHYEVQAFSRGVVVESEPERARFASVDEQQVPSSHCASRGCDYAVNALLCCLSTCLSADNCKSRVGHRKNVRVILLEMQVLLRHLPYAPAQEITHGDVICSYQSRKCWIFISDACFINGSCQCSLCRSQNCQNENRNHNCHLLFPYFFLFHFFVFHLLL